MLSVFESFEEWSMKVSKCVSNSVFNSIFTNEIAKKLNLEN